MDGENRDQKFNQSGELSLQPSDKIYRTDDLIRLFEEHPAVVPQTESRSDIEDLFDEVEGGLHSELIYRFKANPGYIQMEISDYNLDNHEILADGVIGLEHGIFYKDAFERMANSIFGGGSAAPEKLVYKLLDVEDSCTNSDLLTFTILSGVSVKVAASFLKNASALLERQLKLNEEIENIVDI